MKPPESPDERMMDTTEVAKMFDVSYRTVGQWIKDGKLKGVKNGEKGRYKVSVAEVKRFGASKYHLED